VLHATEFLLSQHPNTKLVLLLRKALRNALQPLPAQFSSEVSAWDTLLDVPFRALCVASSRVSTQLRGLMDSGLVVERAKQLRLHPLFALEILMVVGLGTLNKELEAPGLRKTISGLVSVLFSGQGQDCTEPFSHVS